MGNATARSYDTPAGDRLFEYQSPTRGSSDVDMRFHVYEDDDPKYPGECWMQLQVDGAWVNKVQYWKFTDPMGEV